MSLSQIGDDFMEIRLSFSFQDELILPISYYHIVQAFVYSNIGEQLARELHNHGYVYENRRFKLFCFSKLLGDFQIDIKNKRISFASPVQLYITTPIENFAHSLVNTILKNELWIDKTKVFVENVEITDNCVNGDSPFVRAFVKPYSVVTIYSTMTKGDGRKFTHYYMPWEKDYQTLISENLLKKAKILGLPVQKPMLSVRVKGRPKEKLILYKDFVVKGHDAPIILEGDRHLVNTALTAGVGGKNSQGFGMIGLIKYESLGMEK